MTSVRNGLCAAAVVAAQVVAGGWQVPPATRTAASYRLSVTVDPATRQVQGAARVRWQNPTSHPLDELHLLAAWNAWRSPGSTWFVEQPLGGNPALATRGIDDFGWIDIGRLDRTDGTPVDLRGRLRNVTPDDASPQDRTLYAVTLDAPLESGDWITLELTWSGRLPRTFGDSGILGDYLLFGHWFPQVGLVTEAGWQTHQWHAAAAPHTAPADFDVSMTLPEGWLVGATGIEADPPQAARGMVTHRYTARSVVTFAWAASSNFRETREAIAVDGAPVTVRWLLQSEHATQLGRYRDATLRALAWTSAAPGGYPYDALTIIDPPPVVHPAQGEPTDGLAYPMLLTAGTHVLQAPAAAEIERAIIAGVTRQAWFDAPAVGGASARWRADGTSLYLAKRAERDLFARPGAPVERFFGGLLPWTWRGIARSDPPAPPPVDPLTTPAWQAWPGTAGRSSAELAAAWLETAEYRAGRGAVDRALEHLHATGDLDLEILDEASVPARVDYAVDRVEVVSFDDPFTRVIVRRLEAGVVPVDVRIRFDDGTVRTVTWDGQEAWRELQVPARPRVEAVAIDPDGRVPLDRNRTNNTWTARPRAAEAARHWAARWLAWTQELLVTYALVS